MRSLIIIPVLLVVFAALWVSNAVQPEPAVMSVGRILKARGAPTLIASSVEVNVRTAPSRLVQLRFYEVASEKAPDKLTAKDIPPGWCLVYAQDEIFRDAAEAHFQASAHLETFSGSTVWTAADEVGSRFEVIVIARDARGSVVFKGRAHQAHLEAGAKVGTKPAEIAQRL